MAELKTRATKASVTQFFDAIDDEQRRKDCRALSSIMQAVTKAKPVVWGTSIVGFGEFEYYSSRKPYQWFLAGFSPRKAALVVYLMGGRDAALLAKLGKHSMGGSCLYIKRLDDVHQPTLKKLIAGSITKLKAAMRERAKKQGRSAPTR